MVSRLALCTLRLVVHQMSAGTGNCSGARKGVSAAMEMRTVDYWRRRRTQRQARSRRLAQRAQADLGRIVDVLVQEFGVKRIIAFGSLVRGRFAPGSDIDLAVEGISHGDYFAALAAVNRLTPIWVDLKPLEDLDPHFRQRVLTTGEWVYARDVQQRDS